jgi:hypothetical protein
MNFSINYRELLSAYFSVMLWYASWRDEYCKYAHIRMVIDNMSAVSSTDTQNTKHPVAQCCGSMKRRWSPTRGGFPQRIRAQTDSSHVSLMRAFLSVLRVDSAFVDLLCGAVKSSIPPIPIRRHRLSSSDIGFITFKPGQRFM